MKSNASWLRFFQPEGRTNEKKRFSAAYFYLNVLLINMLSVFFLVMFSPRFVKNR